MPTHGKVELTETDYSPDRPKADSPLKIQDLSLRDGHQSLFATRGRTEDMIPVAEMMDDIGFWAMETWGGATFDVMHRFLNEDPWQRIRTLKKYIKKTPFSMLLRGQNLVGYRNYADDLVKTFVGRCAEHGIEVFRVFDALNDFRNLEVVVPEIKKHGKHFQGAISYTMTEPRMGGDIYTLDYYISKAKELEAMGADTICVKDMAGLIAPYDAYAIVDALKKNVTVPVHMHSHCTSGMAQMSMLKAIEAGVDIIDTCVSPYANRTSHPPIEPIVMSLLGTNRDTGLDINKILAVNETLERDVLPKYKHLLDDSKVSVTDINVLLHQTPGGMLSNLFNQLREMDALDRIDDVYRELPKVRKDLGQIPLVTPTSQIVGSQTVNNVLFDTDGQRYTKITDQVKDLCYGLYGKPTVAMNPDVLEKALKDYKRGSTPISCRPGEIIPPELDKAKEGVRNITTDIDDILIYALYPVTGRNFLQWKYNLSEPPDSLKPITLAEAKKRQQLVQLAKTGRALEDKEQKKRLQLSPQARTFHVLVDGEGFEVQVDEKRDSVSVSPAKGASPVTPAPEQKAAPAEKPPASVEGDLEGKVVFTAPMPGMVVSVNRSPGEAVKKGETVLVLEAMKMENALTATADGTIESILCSVGQSVKKNELLFVISP